MGTRPKVQSYPPPPQQRALIPNLYFRISNLFLPVNKSVLLTKQVLKTVPSIHKNWNSKSIRFGLTTKDKVILDHVFH